MKTCLAANLFVDVVELVELLLVGLVCLVED